MATLTVDYTGKRVTYHLKRDDGSEQVAQARSRKSARMVTEFYEARGYFIRIIKGKKGMATNTEKRTENRVKYLSRLDSGEGIDPRGYKTIHGLIDDGLITKDDGGRYAITKKGRKYLRENGFALNADAQTSPAAVVAPVGDAVAREQAAQRVEKKLAGKVQPEQVEQTPSREEIEALKQRWVNEGANWDLDKTEGFEAVAPELRRFEAKYWYERQVAAFGQGRPEILEQLRQEMQEGENHSDPAPETRDCDGETDTPDGDAPGEFIPGQEGELTGCFEANFMMNDLLHRVVLVALGQGAEIPDPTDYETAVGWVEQWFDETAIARDRVIALNDMLCRVVDLANLAGAEIGDRYNYEAAIDWLEDWFEVKPGDASQMVEGWRPQNMRNIIDKFFALLKRVEDVALRLGADRVYYDYEPYVEYLEGMSYPNYLQSRVDKYEKLLKNMAQIFEAAKGINLSNDLYKVLHRMVQDALDPIPF